MTMRNLTPLSLTYLLICQSPCLSLISHCCHQDHASTDALSPYSGPHALAPSLLNLAPNSNLGPCGSPSPGMDAYHAVPNPMALGPNSSGGREEEEEKEQKDKSTSLHFYPLA